MAAPHGLHTTDCAKHGAGCVMREENRPRISVCIANYNGMDIIDGCIESVLAQDIVELVEIIVHDDASTDASAQYIRNRHPGVHLIESSDNVGFCIANNRMVARAQGDYILLLNNDAELFPDALRILYVTAQAVSKPTILSLPQYNTESGALIDRGCLLDPFYNPVPNLDLSRREVAMVIGACLWVPRQLWEDLDGFPTWFESIGEDLYLCCRARLSGCSVQVLPASGYKHRVGSSFGGGKVTSGKRLATTRHRRALSERNKTYTMILTLPAPIFFMVFPIHLGLLLIEGLSLSLLKYDFSLWRDIYHACFKSIWQERYRLIILRNINQKKKAIRTKSFYSAFVFKPYKLQMLLQYGLPSIKS